MAKPKFNYRYMIKLVITILLLCTFAFLTNSMMNKENNKKYLQYFFNNNHAVKLKLNELPDHKVEPKKISIVITGLGLNQLIGESANTLPTSITLGFSPYGKYSEQLANKANALGYETLLYLPLEPINKNLEDNGSLTLLSSLSDEENIDRLKYIFNTYPNITGLYTINKNKFFQNSLKTVSVLTYIGSNNKILLLDSNSSGEYIPEQDIWNSILTANMWLDEQPEAEEIKKKIIEIESIPIKEGTHLIILVKANTVSIQILQEWLENMSEDIEILPISHAVRPVLSN